MTRHNYSSWHVTRLNSTDKTIIIGGYLKTITDLTPVLIKVQGANVSTSTDGVIEKTVAAYRVFPNPAGDFLTIESQAPIERAEVFTTSGVCVRTQTSSEKQICTSGLASGLYILKIYGKQGNMPDCLRFVKQ